MKTAKNILERKKIVVIDDHPIVRRGLAELIDRQADLAFCGGAEDAADALKLIAQTLPDLALVDISLKDSSGIELIKDLRIRFPHLPVLALSVYSESLYAERALRAGARGYAAKDDAAETVMAAIRSVLNGQIYLSERMASRMLSKLIGRRTETTGLTDDLTDREMEVFELTGHGLNTHKIAETLHLSVKTVESHRENIKRKLKLNNGVELLRRAIQWVHFEQTDQQRPI